MTEQLKPCPFCGGSATLSYVGGGVLVNESIKYRSLNCVPKCSNCNCALSCYPTEEEAIQKWNTRVKEEVKQ